jgi:antibiotic biosynthesis monooxygenase (ABM) superfamily enzyme
MDGIIHEAMRFEGHMGVNIIRPPDPSQREYVIIFRFSTYDNLQKWEKSKERKKWLEKGEDVMEGEPRVEMQSVLEFWFTPTSSRQMAPPRYKMAMVTAAVISVLLTTLIPAIQKVAEGLLPFLPRTLLVVAIMVPLMTYVVMPLVTRALQPWLSKKTLL